MHTAWSVVSWYFVAAAQTPLGNQLPLRNNNNKKGISIPPKNTITKITAPQVSHDLITLERRASQPVSSLTIISAL